MRTEKDFVFKKMGDTGVIVPVGEKSFTFNGMVTLNETGSFLWERLEKSATRDELVSALLDEYDTTKETAEKDVDAFLAKLSEEGLLAE